MKTRLLMLAVVAGWASTASAQQVQDLGPGLDAPINDPPLQLGAPGGAGVGAMGRAEVPGSAIQRAWDNAPDSAGIYGARWTTQRVLRMRVREGMASTVALPDGDKVAEYTLADQFNFGAKRTAANPGYLWVWVKTPGYDTNLTIIGESGNIYPLYIRGETWDSPNVPDLVTYVQASQPVAAGPAVQVSGPGGKAVTEAVQASAEDLAGQPPEWLREVPFDPTQVRHDRGMSGDEEIAPVLVFRDERFTYLDYGEKLNDWPAVYQVKDGVDVPVRDRKSPDSRFLVVETVAPITLRLGEKVVCIKPVS